MNLTAPHRRIIIIFPSNSKIPRMSEVLLNVFRSVAVISSVLCSLYSITFNVMKTATCEDNGIVNSLKDVALNFALFPLCVCCIYYEDKLAFYAIIIILSVALMHMSYVRGVEGRTPQIVDVSGKVFIVTGANCGIGLETARMLVEMGGTVVIACRTKEKALIARNDIIQSTKCSDSKVIFLPLDLSNFESIRTFVNSYNSLGLPLHCLINNAGVMMEKREETKSGLEMVITSNHFGHFLLTNLLMGQLESSGEGRVVILTSSLHKIPKQFNFEDIMATKSYGLFETYANSKLANVLHMTELNHRLVGIGSSVTVNCVHPGIVISDVTKNLNPLIQAAYNVVKPLLVLIHKTTRQGAFSSVFAATSKELNGKRGFYIFHSRQAHMSAVGADPIAAKRLWELSEKITDSDLKTNANEVNEEQ